MQNLKILLTHSNASLLLDQPPLDMGNHLVNRLILHIRDVTLPFARTQKHALGISAKLTSTHHPRPKEVEEPLEDLGQEISLVDGVFEGEELATGTEPFVEMRGDDSRSGNTAEDLDYADGVDRARSNAVLCERLDVFDAGAWGRQKESPPPVFLYPPTIS